jgi:hypothetical protein
MSEPLAVVGVEVLAVAVVTIATAVLGWGYRRVQDDIDEVEQGSADASYERRVENLEERHGETRRMAEAAYSGVYGDEDRPEDDGFVVESRESRRQLEEDMAALQEAVSRIEDAQNRHNRAVEAAFESLSEEVDADVENAIPDAPHEGGD